MNRSRTYRWARRAVWGILAVVCTIGCNPLTTIAFLTHKDTPKPARYPLFPKDKDKDKESARKKDKDEPTKVAIFVSQGTGQSYEFAGAESVIASELAKKLPDLAKENKQKLVVIPPAQVNRYKMEHQTWKTSHPAKWGKALGADYVLNIHLTQMSMYQPGSKNTLYEGRAEVEVQMYDVESGEEPENYVHPFSYPKTGFLDATSIPLGTFKKNFLDRLAIEIAQYHVDYKPDSGIAEGR